MIDVVVDDKAGGAMFATTNYRLVVP